MYVHIYMLTVSFPTLLVSMRAEKWFSVLFTLVSLEQSIALAM